MSNPFVGEISMYGFSWSPREWALCNGQLTSIAQNTALFSIIGTIYGGDGRTTMALPNLEHRVPVGAGQGPGLSMWQLGERDGYSGVTLSVSELPSHNHSASKKFDVATEPLPGNNFIAIDDDLTVRTWARNPPLNTLTAMAPESISNRGTGQAHENRQPFLAISFCIALAGVYPARN